MRHLFSFCAAVAVLISSLGATGCGRNNPTATAMTATAENKPETLAFALYGQYAVVLEVALKIAQNPETPTAVKKTLADLEAVATPAANQMRGAAKEYVTVRAALAAQASTPEKVAEALSQLNRILVDAAPKLQAFADATKGSQ